MGVSSEQHGPDTAVPNPRVGMEARGIEFFLAPGANVAKRTHRNPLRKIHRSSTRSHTTPHFGKTRRATFGTATIRPQTGSDNLNQTPGTSTTCKVFELREPAQGLQIVASGLFGGPGVPMTDPQAGKRPSNGANRLVPGMRATRRLPGTPHPTGWDASSTKGMLGIGADGLRMHTDGTPAIC